MAQNRKIGVPSTTELQNSSNVIWINPYTRDDGTQVKGHWRAKHGSISKDGSTFLAATNTQNIENYDSLNRGIDVQEPYEIFTDILLSIVKLFIKDSKNSQSFDTLTPVLKNFASKIFGYDIIP